MAPRHRGEAPAELADGRPRGAQGLRNICIYIYIYTHVYMYVYNYMDIYIYIYIYIIRHRLNGYLARWVPSICLASSFRSCLSSEVLEDRACPAREALLLGE